jgi:hypothetical protein
VLDTFFSFSLPFVPFFFTSPQLGRRGCLLLVFASAWLATISFVSSVFTCLGVYRNVVTKESAWPRATHDDLD